MSGAILYLRVSTTEQATEGISLDVQEDRLRAYCIMRDLDIVQVITDAGVSAGKPLDTRPGGQQLLDTIRRKQADAVVAYKLDRLFRDCADCLTTTKTWDKKGVALHLVDLGGQTLDTSSPMGRFFLTVMAGAAELERNLVSERTRVTMQYKAKKGEYCGGEAPIGRQIADNGIHIEDHDDEQELVDLIHQYRTEGLSIRAVADRLNAEGRKARGKKWHHTSVARVLKRAA